MNGEQIKSETRKVSGFEKVVLQDYGDLEIIMGDEESITIETEAEFLDKIKTEVENGTLKIGIGANWLEKLQHAFYSSFSRTSIKYRLVAKQLSGIEIRGAARVKASKVISENLSMKIGGAGEMTVNGLSTGRLRVELQGAGKISLDGQAQKQDIAISGAGSYHGPDLDTEDTSVIISGSGKATVRAAKQLDVTVSGVGNIDYFGKASLSKTVSGVGRVNHLGE